MSLWTRDLARAYADVRGELSPAARAVWADALRAAIPSAPLRRVLDLGCGTGRFTTFLADVFGAPVIGVDASPDMLRERIGGAALSFVAGDASALPLAAGAIDLALLSMVYHLLTPVAPAIAELRRVIRPEGWAVLRTPTRELLDRVEFLAFFPEARAIDDARMPSRADIRVTFTRAGFVPHVWRIVEQEFSTTPMEAFERVRRRAFSNLRMISDEAFAAGLARYEAHCRDAAPVAQSESLELFVFQRDAS